MNEESAEFRKQIRLLMASLAATMLVLLFSIPTLDSAVTTTRVIVGIFDISIGIAMEYVTVRWMIFWARKGMI